MIFFFPKLKDKLHNTKPSSSTKQLLFLRYFLLIVGNIDNAAIIT